MKIKANQLIADLKNKQPKNEMKKKVYVRRKDFKDFCRCSCPYEIPLKYFSYGSSCVEEIGKCVACPVGILEEHDNEIRQELYEDIRNMILG